MLRKPSRACYFCSTRLVARISTVLSYVFVLQLNVLRMERAKTNSTDYVRLIRDEDSSPLPLDRGNPPTPPTTSQYSMKRTAPIMEEVPICDATAASALRALHSPPLRHHRGARDAGCRAPRPRLSTRRRPSRRFALRGRRAGGGPPPAPAAIGSCRQATWAARRRLAATP